MQIQVDKMPLDMALRLDLKLDSFILVVTLEWLLKDNFKKDDFLLFLWPIL